MSNLILLAARRKLAQYETLGLEEQANRAKKRIAELEAAEEPVEGLSMSNTKAELLAAAEGLDVDESNTKAEILEALEADE